MNTRQYAARRQRLYRHSTTGYIVVAFDGMQQTNDSAAPFIQEANFFYLTGITEPGWVLVVNKLGEEALIAPAISEMHRIFDGGLSNQAAQELSGIESIIPKAEGDEYIQRLLFESDTLGALGPDPHDEHVSFVLNPAPKEMYIRISAAVKTVIDVRPILAKLRGQKDALEISATRHAIAETCEAFKEVKSQLKTARHEYEIDARFTYAFRSKGLDHAYAPIVASAANACTLHYQKNSAPLPENGLVLIDIGARFNGYAADITRTYALGTPTERERAVHAAVEKAHYEIIGLIKPGLGVKDYHKKVDDIMKEALTLLGLLNSPDDYRKYFPHAISHGLGIDVHDPLGAPKEFTPGMILTVEPGIYIPEEGIGVRIEDDILVTEDGHENLSAALPTSL